MNLIIKIYFIVFAIILTMSCKLKSDLPKQDIIFKNEEINSGCSLYIDSFQLGEGIFSPFETVFHDFEKSSNNYDLIIRELGQNSNLIRLYVKPNGDIYIEKYDFNAIRTLKLTDFNLFYNYSSQNSICRYYLCNEGSSDRETFIYAFKINGIYIVKIWFENGDFSDLSKKDKIEIKNFLELINEVKSIHISE